VFRVERKRGPCWYLKYRLPDRRQQADPDTLDEEVTAA
jgi:hypothetical protein